ncbi:MAG: MogA/MoaB family molybdenum cofactor biosynthesis protein [Bacillota bacterium]
MFRVAIVTASDTGSRGEREDVSGQVVAELARSIGASVVSHVVLEDSRELIAREMRVLADDDRADLIITTGGTGLGPRDVTPDATYDVIEFEVPGLAEAMRAAGLQKTIHAALSRATAGVRGRTLIINLPGSPRAVRENLSAVLDALPHAVEVLKGRARDCARLRD